MANRTKKSIKNGEIALLYYAINILLGFFSRKVFIEYLGTEILGLNSTAQNLLGFLNLAELGVGSAVTFTLYKPLAEKNYNQISEIVTIQGWLYRRIATFVAIGSCALMCFFPLIFANLTLPLWYAYSSFGIFLYSSLLTYYVNYKQIIISANQEEYKITYSYKSITLFQQFAQIMAIRYLDNGYLWWLVIQFVGATAASWNLNRIIRRDYPYVRIQQSIGKELSEKYPQIIEKVKQLFFHKIAGFVLMQTSPIIIYSYSTLTLVAIYGNYMLIVNTIILMSSAIFNGITAGVGNLVAEGDSKKILSVFRELFSSRFLYATTLCFCFYHLINSFITLWIGAQYLLDKSTILCIIGIMYINMMRTIVDSYLSAYGLYQDVYAPIIEASLNLGLSILLGFYLGITGILLGVLISMIIIIFFWKPYFLFKYGIKKKISLYIKMYLRHAISLGVTLLIIKYILNFIQFVPNNFIFWILYATIVLVLFSIVLYSIMFFVTPEIRKFTNRFIHR